MIRREDLPTTRALQSLDVAEPELDETQRRRATATLERILASDPHAPSPGTTPGQTRRRTQRRLLAGGLAAAAAVGVPIIFSGGGAFASWSPIPVELTGAARTAAVDACLVVQGTDAEELAFDPDADASVLVAEARGGWSYVVFTVTGRSDRKLQGSCLLPDDLVADPRPGEGGFFGSLGGAEESAGPEPQRDEVHVDESGLGAVDDEAFVYAEGRVGTDVARIEVTTPGGRTVEASIDHGRWAVWWPAGDSSPNNPELSEAPTYEVTLRDGTVTDEVRTAG